MRVFNLLHVCNTITSTRNSHTHSKLENGVSYKKKGEYSSVTETNHQNIHAPWPVIITIHVTRVIWEQNEHDVQFFLHTPSTFPTERASFLTKIHCRRITSGKLLLTCQNADDMPISWPTSRNIPLWKYCSVNRCRCHNKTSRTFHCHSINTAVQWKHTVMVWSSSYHFSWR